MQGRILIVDRDPSAWRDLERAAAAAGCEVLCVPDADSALHVLAADPIDLVLCESDALGGDRRALASRLVRLALHRVHQRQQLQRRAAVLERDAARAAGRRPIVAAAPAMIELLEQIERVAAEATPLLITGERGTGKEGIARAIHAQSPRRGGPFVAVDCATGSERELERLLFGEPAGHAHGDPGQLAHSAGGTLFLDSIDALPVALQSRLLIALRGEEPTGGSASLDLRPIAATASEIERAVDGGALLKELWEWLRALHVNVPALRERREDIPLLVDHFAARARVRPPLTVTADALAQLVAYRWPGNVRELESAIERASVSATSDAITPYDLPLDVSRPAESDPGLALKPARKSFEGELIRRALRATGGNRTRAARLLEISHRALLYKLKEHGIGD